MGGLWARAVLRSYGVEVGSGLRIGSAPVIRRHKLARIRLGRNVSILNEIAENPAGITHPTVLCACQPGAELIIADNVGISGAILYAWKRIEIGEGVFIGADAMVYDSDFHSLEAADRRQGDRNPEVAPVVIGPEVWLGARCMVLKGVTIGRGAVVAAGAIVTKDVPAGMVAAGVPARIIGPAKKPEAPGAPPTLSPADAV